MDSGKSKDDEAKVLIDEAVLDLVRHRESITFAQLKRILADAIPLRLSGTLALTIGTLLVTSFGLGWKGYDFLQGIKKTTPPPPVSLTPTETVQLDFTHLDQGHDDKAWQMYAPPPDGKSLDYDQWKGWWNRVDRVAIKEIAPMSESPFQAVVRYRLEFKRDHEETIRLGEPSQAVLVRDAKDKPWEISYLESLKRARSQP
jgi:hypothetical protein